MNTRFIFDLRKLWRAIKARRYRSALIIGILLIYTAHQHGLIRIPDIKIPGTEAPSDTPGDTKPTSPVHFFPSDTEIKRERALALSPYRPNTKFDSRTKRMLYQIHREAGQEKTFYCDCDYTSAGRKKFDADSCGLVLTKYKKATGVDAEHVVPESALGYWRECWKRGGRKACEDDPVHQLAASDLHNLRPSVPAINRLRSNYKFVDAIQGERRDYGSCDMEIDSGTDTAEPPPAKKGDIARTYLYMSAVHGLELSEDERAMYLEWHRTDPPDDWEIQRNERIAEIQGNRNPFISKVSLNSEVSLNYINSSSFSEATATQTLSKD